MTAVTPWGEVQTAQDLRDGGVTNAVFWQQILERRLRRVTSAHWPIDSKTLAELGDVELMERYSWGEQALVDRDGWLARVSVENGELNVRVGAGDDQTVAEAIASIAKLFPRSEPGENEMPITFWTYTPHGARAVSRRISAPSWEDIAGNYAAATRRRLEAMVEGFRPSYGGQLILWQGEPGTGKTWALRALAWEWREWAEFHYVVDPDALFGEHPDYLIEVLLHDCGEHVTVVGGDPDPPERERWRVLILEDTGEILAADAKERTGQALSRLLNVVDGLIGQGLRVLVLVTTNEELKRLHPAVARPGRCAARITFEPLSVEEATAWLDERSAIGPTAPGKLAELYALAEGYAVDEQTASVGFI